VEICGLADSASITNFIGSAGEGDADA